MICLAIPFVIGPLRTTTMGMRILVGVGFGLVFYLSNQFAGPFSVVFHLSPFAAAVSPLLLFCLVGACLLIREAGLWRRYTTWYYTSWYNT